MNTSTTDFDYIIIGAGAAGLMLADAMGKDIFFQGKSILLIEKDAKQTNDRTWCFWEREVGQFDALIYKSWNEIYFGGKSYNANLNIAPYRYKMIRGIDFYAAYLKKIHGYPNISYCNDTVIKIDDRDQNVKISTSENTYRASQVFNSAFNFKTLLEQDKYPVLQQHFVGWFVKTKNPVFDPTTATFMDFSIPQKGNTRFIYLLPFSETEALVEYTLFSADLLPENEYEEALISYLKNHLSSPEYEILEKEKGLIPMTCYDFEASNSANVLHIGTAGGWAKASTGYAFMNTFKNTIALVQHLKKRKGNSSFTTKNRFRSYDLLLLDILYTDNEKGHYIFETLFKNRSPQLILRFLDEETTLWEDLKIIAACPKRIFLRALFKRVYQSRA